MAERLARVVAVHAGVVWLQADAPCSDCGGCGGRCNLFAATASREPPGSSAHGPEGALQLPARAFGQPPSIGQQVVLELPGSWLATTALRGYGVPLLGMLAGAAGGHALGLAAQMAPDLPALAGAVLGTFMAFTLSKGIEPHISVRTPCTGPVAACAGEAAAPPAQAPPTASAVAPGAPTPPRPNC